MPKYYRLLNSSTFLLVSQQLVEIINLVKKHIKNYDYRKKVIIKL